MKILILYHSEHHGNTKRIAEAMAQKVGASILNAKDAWKVNINDYDLIGFGSGVYNGKLHDELSDWFDKVTIGKGKKSFIFSTTGSKTYSSMAHNRFRPKLEKKGFKVVGELSCLGFDTALTPDGINKGKPDLQDIKDAECFIEEMIDS